MLVWFAETSLIAVVLAAVAMVAGRWTRLGPGARHALWLVVMIKLVTPPVVSWPWAVSLASPPHEVAASPEAKGRASKDVLGASLDASRSKDLSLPVTTHLLVVPAAWADSSLASRGTLGVWCLASAALALWHISRVACFRRRLGWALPAPDWLVEQALCVAHRLGVRAPEILVVPGLTTPMLWFLGRPKLLVPAGLVKTLGSVGWQGILAHELAHLSRRDHWVRRVELAAGLFWWWNPLYWLTRGRLEAEAELACDEWAVRVFPEGRLDYAEALLQVCKSHCLDRPPEPALGIAGAGRFLERRVTMILRDQIPFRASRPVLIGAGLLALVALPSWSASATSDPDQDKTDQSAASPVATAGEIVSSGDDKQVTWPANGADSRPADRATNSRLPRRTGRQTSDNVIAPPANDLGDVRPDHVRRGRNSADARPDEQETRSRQLRRQGPVSTRPALPPNNVHRGDARPAIADVDSASPDARPNGDPTPRRASQDVNDARIAGQRGGQIGLDVQPGKKTIGTSVGRDRQKAAASESRGREQRTRSRRIREMRALIDQLQNELE
ncbi:MAG TPA: M56 family metallopeptidase, partial [Isosphaeraceae bacterium]|nr:M56 family metallopeptidase [Isosphaeraceae bacterium]